jgi:hypothetical protein
MMKKWILEPLIDVTVDKWVEYLFDITGIDQTRLGRLIIGGKWEKWLISDDRTKWFHVNEFTDIKRLQKYTLGYEPRKVGEQYLRNFKPSSLCIGDSPIEKEFRINNSENYIKMD